MTSATTTAPLLLERDGAIATLRFNRPEALNAIDGAMAQALLTAVKQLMQDDSVRAVILCGAGKGFMAGGDLAMLRAAPVQAAAELITPLNEAITLLSQLNAPVIAQVHGVVAGAGLSLMLQADFVLAAENTRMNLAYINLGASCDVGASWMLPRLVGLGKALEIALLGETFSATQAQQWGLIYQALPAEQLPSATQALAQRLANGPTQAYGAMRRLLRSAFDRPMPAQLAAEGQAFIDCAATQDFRTGVEAFYAKTTPRFTGQ